MSKRSDDANKHPYPPDTIFRERFGFSFTWTLVSLTLLVAALEFIRVGAPDTGIPYNYPLFFGVVYLIAAVFLLRHYHTLIDRAKLEIIDVLELTDLESDILERETDITPAQIETEVHGVLDRAFHPVALLGGWFVGGLFAIVVMWLLGAFEYYPYVLMNFAYGAGHGLFFAPILATIWLVRNAIRAYIVDIDVLDPDGVGGYRQVGNSIVNLISYGIVLVTLDFVVLSSVMFVDEPLFQALVVGLYVLMVVFLLAIAASGIYGLRRAMLSIRDQKTDALREEFRAVESRYYRKLERGESPEPESQHIETMTTMFDQFHSMGLWPINLAAFLRLAATTGASVLIAAYRMGLLSTSSVSLLSGLV